MSVSKMVGMGFRSIESISKKIAKRRTFVVISSVDLRPSATPLSQVNVRALSLCFETEKIYWYWKWNEKHATNSKKKKKNIETRRRSFSDRWFSLQRIELKLILLECDDDDDEDEEEDDDEDRCCSSICVFLCNFKWTNCVKRAEHERIGQR